MKQYGITMNSTAKEASAPCRSGEGHDTTSPRVAGRLSRKLTNLEAIDAGVKETVGNAGDRVKEDRARQCHSRAEEIDRLSNRDPHPGAGPIRKRRCRTRTLPSLQLSNKIKNQASSSVDSWGGKIDVLKTKIGDWVDQMGQRFGPAITAVGTGLTAAGAISEMWGTHVAHAAKVAADAEDASAASSKIATATHADSSAEVATAAAGSSSAVVQAEAVASAAEDDGATNSSEVAASHVASSAQVGTAATAAGVASVAASDVIIGGADAAAAAVAASGEEAAVGWPLLPARSVSVSRSPPLSALQARRWVCSVVPRRPRSSQHRT